MQRDLRDEHNDNGMPFCVHNYLPNRTYES